MILQDVLAHSNFSTFLVDASGVIVSKHQYVPNISNTITKLQSMGQLFLVTNNSYVYPEKISHRMLKNGNISISPNHIISSGEGLAKCTEIAALLHNKRAYFLGHADSKPYLTDSPILDIVSTLDDANIIVMAAFLINDSNHLIDNLISHLRKNPNIPVICCNPDRYITAPNGLHPVVGYYAERIEQETTAKMHWFGKPLENFSLFVQSRLSQYQIKCNANVCFFDDNLQNVVNMQHHIGITGFWVKQTGIYSEHNTSDLFDQFGTPNYQIDALSLDAEVISY